MGTQNYIIVLHTGRRVKIKSWTLADAWKTALDMYDAVYINDVVRVEGE